MNRRLKVIVVVGIVLVVVTLVFRHEREKSIEREIWAEKPLPTSNLVMVSVRGNLPRQEAEELARISIVHSKLIPIFSQVYSNQPTADTNVLMKALYVHEIIESDERTIGRLEIRSRIEMLGFRFASYEEMLSYLAVETPETGYRINTLVRARSNPEGYNHNNVISIQIRGKKVVTILRPSGRFNRHDCFLVVREK